MFIAVRYVIYFVHWCSTQYFILILFLTVICPVSKYNIILYHRHYFSATRGLIHEFCNQCPICQLSAPQTNRPPLKLIIECEFLRGVQIDLTDIRHCTDGEYSHIGHFEDHFSKFNILFPLKTKSADEVSTMLEERVSLCWATDNFSLWQWQGICELTDLGYVWSVGRWRDVY